MLTTEMTPDQLAASQDRMFSLLERAGAGSDEALEQLADLLAEANGWDAAYRTQFVAGFRVAAE